MGVPYDLWAPSWEPADSSFMAVEVVRWGVLFSQSTLLVVDNVEPGARLTASVLATQIDDQ